MNTRAIGTNCNEVRFGGIKTKLGMQSNREGSEAVAAANDRLADIREMNRDEAGFLRTRSKSVWYPPYERALFSVKGWNDGSGISRNSSVFRKYLAYKLATLKTATTPGLKRLRQCSQCALKVLPH